MTAYAELHCHSCFSLLDGASTPEALVAQASALELPALALTDHDAVYGAPAFVRAAREAGIQPILGAELTLEDDTHLTLLVETPAGWANLCALISAARADAPKGEARLPPGVLAQHTAGLIALTGCRRGRIPRALLAGDRPLAERAAGVLCEQFGRSSVFIELQQHLLPDDGWMGGALAALAGRLKLPLVASNNVHYASAGRKRLQDVLVAIREKCALDEAAGLRANAEYRLKSARELAPLFSRWPGTLERTLEIAGRCHFTLAHGLQALPPMPTPPGMDADGALRQWCAGALAARGMTQATAQLEHELAVIHAGGLANYFLVVADIVRFARSEGILCQGRGSAANSLVAWLLDISPINPLEHDLLFERFLSAERQAVPDIDIDFDAARREEVIQYLYRRYGHDQASMACTFVTFQARSALRDVGKALGLPPDVVAHAASALDTRRARDLGGQAGLEEAVGAAALENPVWQQALHLAEQMDGLPRHLGIHNGGMVVSGQPLQQRVPVEPATMQARTVVQWDKEGLEDAGMVKIDILGLRMLSVLAECAAAIRADVPDFTFDRLTPDDDAVFAMIRRADTVGVFQVESHAQMQVLPRLKPAHFNDLIISTSLIRPGPVQGNMVHPYLRRRAGTEAVSYPHPLLESALAETLGVILFQEQVLKVARDAAGFTPGQGELLRRALGAKDPQAALTRFQQPFVDGAAARGIDAATAHEIFERLRAFGGYSFPKSHAASFAVIVYRSAWLKWYHPAIFAAALLNHQPMGFWSPSVILNDVRRHGIAISGVDIAQSEAETCGRSGRIRLGLRMVHGLDADAARIVAVRCERPFDDLHDFMMRVPLPRRVVEALILAGAFDGWKRARRELLWEAGAFRGGDALGLPAALTPASLPALREHEALALEAAAAGVLVGAHPLKKHRRRLSAAGAQTSQDIRRAADGARVAVVGLLVMHQAPPTAKGFRFLTLEDEYGMIPVVVRPQVYAHCRRDIRRAPLLLVRGRVQHEGDVINILAAQIRAWPAAGAR